MADKIKLVLAVLLVIAGIAGFYMLTDSALILRVASVLAGLVAAALGRMDDRAGPRILSSFAQESVTETKKVVWPSRKETVQTTGHGARVRAGHGDVPVDGGRAPGVGREILHGAGGVMSKKWYVVHAYSGFEKSVQRALSRTHRARRHGGQVRPDPGAGRGSGRDEERPEEHQRAQVLPGLCAGRNGNDRRDLAPGQEHRQGHRLRRRAPGRRRRRSAKRKCRPSCTRFRKAWRSPSPRCCSRWARRCG